MPGPRWGDDYFRSMDPGPVYAWVTKEGDINFEPSPGARRVIVLWSGQCPHCAKLIQPKAS